jgi:hypothetical protein
MSFFQWVREEVRQAVVLGFADAVDDIGSRSRGEDFGPALAQNLRNRLAVQPEQTVIDSTPAAGGRRRLGRSLAKTAVAPKASSAAKAA